MKSYGLCNFVESLFSYVVLIFRETLFTCFTWNYMMPSILKSQGVFKINVFSHCFPIKRKSSYDFVVTAWFLMWTSLGLNQGPPDYESVALTNWATSPACQHGCDKFCGAKVRIMSEMCKFFSFKFEKMRICCCVCCCVSCCASCRCCRFTPILAAVLFRPLCLFSSFFLHFCFAHTAPVNCL